jgi:hypothetical protein
MKKKERVYNALHRKKVDFNPIFISSTPQFWQKCLKTTNSNISPTDSWKYQVDLGLDIIQVGHPSFYPVKVLELPEGSKYIDDFNRTHIISGYYDNFTKPFPL